MAIIPVPLQIPPRPGYCSPEWMHFWDNLVLAAVDWGTGGSYDVVNQRGPDLTLLTSGVKFVDAPPLGTVAHYQNNGATNSRRSTFRLGTESANPNTRPFSGLVLGRFITLTNGNYQDFLIASGTNQQTSVMKVASAGTGYSANDFCVLFRNNDATFNTIVVKAAASVVAGTWYLVGFSWDGTTGYVYLDGEFVNSIATSSRQAAQQINLGSDAILADLESVDGNVPLAYYWDNRVLTAEDFKQLATDPFGPVRTPIRLFIQPNQRAYPTKDLIRGGARRRG